MAGLGTYLNQLRKERGPSIEELARVTRVASRYLEALERDDFDTLPAPVFTRGYIRAYCQALGVPADEALSRYAETVKVPVPPAPVAVTAAQSSADDGRRARGTLLLSFVLLVGFGVALFAATLFLQSGRPGISARPAAPPTPKVEVAATTSPAPPAPEPAPTTPEPAAAPTPEVPSPVASPPAPAAPTPPAPSAPATSPAAAPAPATQKPASSPAAAPAVRAAEAKPATPAESRPATEPPRPVTVVVDPPPLQLRSVVSPYRLVARTMEATWLRVRTDDGRASEETIPAGEVREWISNRPFIVTIGNAAGVALELNGQKLPPLGGHGAVINRLILPPAEP
ncbi:MAG TPA: RodZ domain-containing protein [Candidatus Acidoferrum sp.]|nr:RodZ domain-containing protein [Candidatus Acidoferrum sp.]